MNTLRNAHLGLLHETLTLQQARKIDVVAPAHDLWVDPDTGQLTIVTDEVHVGDEGVTPISGRYEPTTIFDEGAADRFDIPIGYLRRCRRDDLGIYAANLNGWLDHQPGRQFLVRLLSNVDGGMGLARAMLSDRFRIIDNLDVLLTILEGVRAAGVEVQIKGADLSERRMTVRIVCPEVQALAPTLLKGYRSPFSGQTGEENPVVWAGFRFSNSETGGGAFNIVPELEVQVCKNGMTVFKDALRAVHLGARLDEGVVQWSGETQEKSLELIRSQAKDAVATFLDVDYMKGVIAAAEDKAAEEVSPSKVTEVIKSAKFTQEQADGILSHFIQSGQMTVGGVYNAATSWVQTVEDPDVAYEVEQRAATLLSLA